MRNYGLTLLMLLLTLQFSLPSSVHGMTEQEKKMKKLEDLRRKIAERKKKDAAKNQEMVGNQNLGMIIKNYENYLRDNCQGKQSSRCADAMYSIGSNAYKKAQIDFVNAQKKYENDMDRWEKRPRGPEPIAPIPDYSKALNAYQDAVKMYPNYGKAAEGYFQMGAINMINSEIDAAQQAFLTLVKRYPKDPRAATSHYRIAELYFMKYKFGEALKHYNLVEGRFVTIDMKETVHYRKGEIYYSRGDLDKAVELLSGYVDNCDINVYPKKLLRGDAVDYLATAFADMGGDGTKKAIKFFKGKNRTYEDTVIYNIGFKHYEHGQWPEAIEALTHAIQKFPNFDDAPKAQTNIVYSYVTDKKHEDANKARGVLVDTYGKHSRWVAAHSGQSIVLAKAENEVKKTLSSIGIYYHDKALRETELKDHDKAQEYYESAIKRYLEYVTNYPDEKWQVFEHWYDLAEAYNSIKNYERSAFYYDKVASAQLASYPKFTAELDTIGLEQEEIEKMKQAQKKSPVAISQEDAGFNAIVSMENMRKEQISSQGLDSIAAYRLPATAQFIEYIHNFQSRFPNGKNSAEVLFLAAGVMFTGHDYAATIKECQMINAAYGSQDSTFRRATELMANAYAQNKQFQMAGVKYDTLITLYKNDPEKRNQLTLLASGAIFNNGMMHKENRQYTEAVPLFKSIVTRYPTADTVAVKGWLEAAICLDSAKQYEESALTYKELTTRFPQSEFVKNSFIEAANNYAKIDKNIEAAQTMQLAAKTVPDAEYAIPALSKAANYYKAAGKAEEGADMLYLGYQRYPNDKNSAGALYNAGLIYEDSTVKNYTKAIEVYSILSDKFSTSEFAPSGAFSIGLCYEKMDERGKMATAFESYANKYTSKRESQVIALTKAAEARREMSTRSKGKQSRTQFLAQAVRNLDMATQIYDKFHKDAGINPYEGAKAYFIQGEIYRDKVNSVRLDNVKNATAVKLRMKKKEEYLKPTIEAYTESIKQGTEVWTLRSTYAIAELYIGYAGTVRNQKIFGSEEEKVAAKIQIVGSLDPYYTKAMEKLDWIIRVSQDQGLTNEYVKKSEVMLTEMAYRRGNMVEEMGTLYRDAPVPYGLSEADEEAYYQALEEKYIQHVEAAYPRYEEGLGYVKNLHISHNEWADSIKTRLGLLHIELNYEGESDYANLDLDAEKRKYEDAERIAQQQRDANNAHKTVDQIVQEELAADLAKINSIYNDPNMSDDDKIAKLAEIEALANMIIGKEEKLIKDLNAQLTVQ